MRQHAGNHAVVGRPAMIALMTRRLAQPAHLSNTHLANSRAHAMTGVMSMKTCMSSIPSGR